MITAERLRQYMNLTKQDLKFILADSGYTGQTFKSVEFLGITNGEQFCYRVTYFDDAGTGEVETGKVFVSHDLSTGRAVADF